MSEEQAQARQFAESRETHLKHLETKHMGGQPSMTTPNLNSGGTDYSFGDPLTAEERARFDC